MICHRHSADWQVLKLYAVDKFKLQVLSRPAIIYINSTWLRKFKQMLNMLSATTIVSRRDQSRVSSSNYTTTSQFSGILFKLKETNFSNQRNRLQPKFSIYGNYQGVKLGSTKKQLQLVVRGGLEPATSVFHIILALYLTTEPCCLL